MPKSTQLVSSQWSRRHSMLLVESFGRRCSLFLGFAALQKVEVRLAEGNGVPIVLQTVNEEIVFSLADHSALASLSGWFLLLDSDWLVAAASSEHSSDHLPLKSSFPFNQSNKNTRTFYICQLPLMIQWIVASLPGVPPQSLLRMSFLA